MTLAVTCYDWTQQSVPLAQSTSSISTVRYSRIDTKVLSEVLLGIIERTEILKLLPYTVFLLVVFTKLGHRSDVAGGALLAGTKTSAPVEKLTGAIEPAANRADQCCFKHHY